MYSISYYGNCIELQVFFSKKRYLKENIQNKRNIPQMTKITEICNIKLQIRLCCQTNKMFLVGQFFAIIQYEYLNTKNSLL